MSGKNDDETLSEAERLISEYKNTSSTREKIKKIQAFNDLWDCANSEYYMYTGMLQGMQHVGLLPLIIESLTSRECVTMERVELQTLMLTELRMFFRCCMVAIPNPWLTHFSQFEGSVIEAFACSFDIIEEKSHEDYILQLQLGLLPVLGVVFNFFDMLNKAPQIIKRINIPKILDTVWAVSFTPLSQSLDAYDLRSTRNPRLLSDFPSIFSSLNTSVPSWYTTYHPAAIHRAVVRYGPKEIAQRMKELFEDPQTPSNRLNIETIGTILTQLTPVRPIAVELIKASLPCAFLHAYWTWLRKADELEEQDAAIEKLVFQTICGSWRFSPKTAEEKALFKRAVQDLLDEDYMSLIGRTLVVAQYEEDFMTTDFSALTELFDGVFKQVYGAKCEDRELWHGFSHVLNCARAYCRVHGDPPVLRRDTIYGYRAVTYLWHNLGMSIGVREDIWWNEFVWGKLPLEVRKMGCSWMKCPNFGMDYMDLVTAGPTPLVCSKCRAAFYCSIGCQKEDWNQGNHRRQCLGKGLSTTPSRGGIAKRDP